LNDIRTPSLVVLMFSYHNDKTKGVTTRAVGATRLTLNLKL